MITCKNCNNQIYARKGETMVDGSPLLRHHNNGSVWCDLDGTTATAAQALTFEVGQYVQRIARRKSIIWKIEEVHVLGDIEQIEYAVSVVGFPTKYNPMHQRIDSAIVHFTEYHAVPTVDGEEFTVTLSMDDWEEISSHMTDAGSSDITQKIQDQLNRQKAADTLGKRINQTKEN